VRLVLNICQAVTILAIPGCLIAFIAAFFPEPRAISALWILAAAGFAGLTLLIEHLIHVAIDREDARWKSALTS